MIFAICASPLIAAQPADEESSAGTQRTAVRAAWCWRVRYSQTQNCPSFRGTGAGNTSFPALFACLLSRRLLMPLVIGSRDP
jgi:hypothetical protein